MPKYCGKAAKFSSLLDSKEIDSMYPYNEHISMFN